ncbi:MAG TPA: ATP-binding protein [Polyangiaceae bacterium]|nr:ATP-binding protein [Polyangiaceae bacterium]
MTSDAAAELDYRALFEAGPGPCLVLTPELTIVTANDAYLSATMTTREAIVGRGLFDVFPDNPNDPGADGVANLRSSLERVLKTGRPDAMAVQKYDVRRPDSEGGAFETRFWSPNNSPVFDSDGRLIALLHRVEDVTEFMCVREEERAQERLNQELKIRAEAMEAEVYRRAQELQQANQDLRALHAELEQRVHARTAELEAKNEELRQEAEARRQAQAALSRSEEQLRHSQKMEAVGRLAGSIAHDFNNLLSVILSYSVMLQRDLKPMDPIRGDVESIRKAGERAAELTRQLLAFSRQQVLAPRLVDMNDAVHELERMVTRLLGEDVELSLHYERSVWPVRVDPGQMDQVLMNLIVNARDAMPRGGQLTIETRNVVLDERHAREHLGVAPGAYVLIAVSDTGVGMDKATQGRIFEPFFTTKGVGKGTGLGLATAFGIVQQSGGTIWVYSEPGKGSTFKVYLPKAEGPGEPYQDYAEPRTLNGTETILLVEDENEVRIVAREILRRHGYDVLDARNAGEALLTCERFKEPIHLLLTDVVMPQMSGRELSERLLRLRPEMKVLFMSGYTENAIVHHGILDSGIAYLQKPLVPDALARRVRAVLDAPARTTGFPHSG